MTESNEMEPVRTAIIGTGAIANAHVRAIREMAERVHLVAAMDIDRERIERFANEYDIPYRYTDAAELLAAQQPRLVLIATPPGTHTDLIIQSLEAGAWVLCEKPLCGSLAELDRIMAAEARTGNFCSSVFQWRFGSGAQHLKHLIDTNAMGRPLVGVCNTTWYRDMTYYGVPWRGTWDMDFGGPTMILGIHPTDMLLWLLGDWQEVRAMIGTLDREIEVEDVSMAIVRFARDTMVSFVNSALSPRQQSFVRLDFQQATVELTCLYGYTNEDWRYSIATNAPYADDLARWGTIPAAIPSSHGTQLAAFLDSMERNERPPVSGPEARRTIEFVSSLYKSAATGAPVLRGSIRPGDPFYDRISGTASDPR
jgi:predicted dehydrogenase